MITIRKQLEAHWWRLDESDTASPEFFCKPLTRLQLVDVTREMGMDQFDRFAMTGKGIKTLFTFGLLDWRHIVDEQGKPIKFSQSEAENLPASVLTAVAGHIFESSVVTAEQKKS